MSKWSDRITSHPIWEEMKKLGAALDLVIKKYRESPEVIIDIERIRRILTYCGTRLASTDPYLLNPALIDPINVILGQIRAELELFIGDANINHFDTIGLRVDELLIHFRHIPAQGSEELTLLSSSITSYRETLESYLNEFQEKAKVLRAAHNGNKQALANLEELIKAEQIKITALTSESQSQFSTAQDKRASEFSATLADNQKQFSDNQIANQGKFAETINQYTKEFSGHSDSFAKMQADAEQRYEKDLLRLKNSYEKSAKAILSEITDQKTQVEKLVGVIGNLGLTSGYLRTANHARKVAYLWQFLTVAALSGLIYVAYTMAFPSAEAILAEAAKNAQNDGSLFYKGLAVRVFLSITFGVFAAYSATQANKFLKTEGSNRKLALELEALGPFISSLPEDVQHKFKVELGERSFGLPESTATEKESDPVSFLDLVKSKELEDMITRIIKAIKGD